MKLTADRPFADPEKAARKLLEIANATEAVQDGRIHIEKINEQFLFKEGGTPTEYSAGLACSVAKGWLWKHEGIWTEFKGDRGTKSKPVPGPHLVYGFPTTAPNAVVEPIHPKAMPVILTTDEERDVWMRALG